MPNVYAQAHRLFSSNHLRGENIRVFRASIMGRSQKNGFPKSDSSKLFEEGTSFLRSSNSSKPVRLVVLNLLGERFCQYEFGSVD